MSVTKTEALIAQRDEKVARRDKLDAEIARLTAAAWEARTGEISEGKTGAGARSDSAQLQRRADELSRERAGVDRDAQILDGLIAERQRQQVEADEKRDREKALASLNAAQGRGVTLLHQLAEWFDGEYRASVQAVAAVSTAEPSFEPCGDLRRFIAEHLPRTERIEAGRLYLKRSEGAPAQIRGFAPPMGDVFVSEGA